MQVCGGFMEDLTVPIIHASYILGSGLFLLAMAARRVFARVAGVSTPAPATRGKVPVWFYRNADLLGILLFSSLFYVMAVSNARGTADTGGEIQPENVLFAIAVQLFMPAMAYAIVARRASPLEWLGLRWKEWPHVFAIVPLGVVGMFLFSIILYFTGYRDLLEAVGAAGEQEAVTLFREGTDPLILTLMAVAAVIVAPVCEEIVFRGYLYSAAKKHAGSTAAAFFSALVFAGAHGNVAALLPLFVFGLVLVAAYEFTGSIWAPMAIHAGFNGSTVVIQFLMRYAEVPQTISG